MLKLDEFLPADWATDPHNIKAYRHSLTVANVARRIAGRISALDPDIAYTYGLMHDVGKFYVAAEEAYRHPRVGYELLKGTHNDIAEICISHAFPNFDAFDHILSYCHGDEPEARKVYEILSTITRSLYVCLIQFCDKVSGLDDYMTIEAKYAWYMKRHALAQNEETLRYLKTLQATKAELDTIAGVDLYGLIGA
jgi:putative nucleotidyltransferase with HDIG domain